VLVMQATTALNAVRMSSPDALSTKVMDTRDTVHMNMIASTAKNPPRLTVVNMCTHASSQVMPASL
jgi:hypothetical protein